MDAFRHLNDDNELFMKCRKNAQLTANNFDFDDVVPKYINYFDVIAKRENNQYELNEWDKVIYNAMNRTREVEIPKKRKIYYIAKFVPKPIKKFLKKIITFLYFCFEH